MPTLLLTQQTPNPLAYKFAFDSEILPSGFLEFEKPNPDIDWLNAIFSIKGVDRVYIAANFITVVKKQEGEWIELNREIRTILTQIPHFNDLQQLKPQYSNATTTDDALAEWFTRTVLPATEGDGGGIYLRAFADGVMTLEAVGACKACPWLKDTIESGIVKKLVDSGLSLKKVNVQ
jgi:Fe-S cluster biogenesis protein NfuA